MVPLGFVIGPLLLNVYLNDLYLTKSTDGCNFVDHTTLLACDKYKLFDKNT